MHSDFSLFATITMAILVAFVSGFIARKLGVPAMVGYLIAGMVIGPFTPGFVGDTHAAGQLAEMGVVFMMFGVGLHFSLKDLWSVRKIALPGATLQMFLATLCGFVLSQFWGWSVSAGLVLGVAISIASTVVLLRGLSDNGLLSTNYGKVAVGWLVLEDLATVAILVLLPTLVNGGANPLEGIGVALLKTAIFVVIMLFVGARLMPWLLTQIAHTRSQELFILAVVTVALGTAFAAYELFGVSLALGAFLAGVIVSESDVSHQVGAQITPFRDVFSVIFFVSVGMLVNPSNIVANAGPILMLTFLIIIGKTIITLGLGLVLPASGRTLIVVAAGLSQIGEFSFIVGQAGVALGLLTQDQYGLILASAVFSILVNPLMFRAIPWIEKIMKSIPALWQRMEHGAPIPQPFHQSIEGHVVVVGYGRVGKHIGQVMQYLKLPYLVVELDAVHASHLQQSGIPTLFGDAANSEILTHCHLDHARALVVTVPNEATSEMVVAAGRDLAPNLPIIARAGTESGVHRLAALGAQHVIHPELEGGLEVVRHTLATLGYPTGQIQPYVDKVRSDAYDRTLEEEQKASILDQLMHTAKGIEIGWHPITEGSSVINQSLAEANIRSHVGASVIALIRDHKMIPNPKSETRFQEGDLVGLIGSEHELSIAGALLNPSRNNVSNPN